MNQNNCKCACHLDSHIDLHCICTCNRASLTKDTTPSTLGNYLKTGPTHCLHCHLDYETDFKEHAITHYKNEHETIPCEEVKCKAYKTKSWPEINESIQVKPLTVGSFAPNIDRINKANRKYDNFVIGARNAGFTDDQINFLWSERL